MACVWLVLATATSVRAQDDASVESLRRWVSAVREHGQGKPDAAAGVIASMSYAERSRLNPAMQVFQRVLRVEPGRPQTRPIGEIFALARSVRQDPGVAPFLRRAAILHSDAAIYRENFPEPPDDPPITLGSINAPPRPPLLFNERLLTHLDGQVVGETLAEWNWPFARSLLDLLLARAAVIEQGDRELVAAWYHAVAAYLFATSRDGDLKMHLQHASTVLPDDPRILFDRGCFAEKQGLPIVQTLAGDSSNTRAMARFAIDIPAQGRTDSEAEAQFRRALQIDPGYAEARVRLARLLERRGRRDEAAEEIDRALAARLDGMAAFYAHLFGGRIALARDRPADALGHYRAAAVLYPGAQSALLGASQAAVIASDVPAALAFVQRLGPRSADADTDPWWQYRFGPGRDVKTLIAAVWARLR
jgi:tetratricopeptide (TPR) repeat protein